MNTLESEVKKFVDGLPYWAKYLCSIILCGKTISENEIDIAHNYLLEYLNLHEAIEKPSIQISVSPKLNDEYKDDLKLTELDNVEGVNALINNQVIKFNKNITIVYGENGSGKSGYVRLLKKAFYSKSEEAILSNIYDKNAGKNTCANFNFHSGGSDISLGFPEDSDNAIFDQYSIFDGKSVLRHLDERNNFEFRPAALGLFYDLIASLNRLQSKHQAVVNGKNTINNYNEILVGESVIKELVTNLSFSSNFENLKKHTPYTDHDITRKLEKQKEYDELKLSLGSKDKKLKELLGIKQQLLSAKKNLTNINSWFTTAHLEVVCSEISDCNAKQLIAINDSVENFKTEKINSVGSEEWKEFLVAANKLALAQKDNGQDYPEIGDNCLLCHQPILKEQQQLISSYWGFIKSVAEKEANESQLTLNKKRIDFEKLPFEQFQEGNVLTVWLLENHPKILILFNEGLKKQQALSAQIISQIDAKATFMLPEIQIDLTPFDVVDNAINGQIKILQDGNENTVLNSLQNEITYLSHKEKLHQHYDNIVNLYNNMVWSNKAGKVNWQGIKTKVTTTEKGLSKTYFNKQYVDNFNDECNRLRGNFGIDINARSSGAVSNRQLLIKGKTPSTILSEGEQKVIALADFFSEADVSSINKGIILDDPVNSLDDARKSRIAKRLIEKALEKQVVVFTHDLVFLSMLTASCIETSVTYDCHWIEKRDINAGYVWLNNSPSYEKEYRNSVIPIKHYSTAKKADTEPAQREYEIKAAFTALRTCYEVLVINDLFKNVVKRFDERVSVDSLSSVYFDKELVNELLDSFGQCCRYMEGHTHSDKYAYKKPDIDDINKEIQRYEALRGKIKKYKPKKLPRTPIS